MTAGDDAGERIQIVVERAHVTKRAVETGHVRVSTVVELREEIVSETLQRQALSIERRSVLREVAAAPPPREDGDATIISIVEERVVITKALFVIEELVIHRTQKTEVIDIPVQLRATRAVVEHDPITDGREQN